MMKNSKLSKLLVAGVSVAMLASALAPMAFAEENSKVSISGNLKILNAYVCVEGSEDFKWNDDKYTIKGFTVASPNPDTFENYVELGTSEFKPTKNEATGEVEADLESPIWTKSVASDIVKTTRWTEFDKWSIWNTETTPHGYSELDKTESLNGGKIAEYTDTDGEVAFIKVTLKDKPAAEATVLDSIDDSEMDGTFTAKTEPNVNGDAALYDECATEDKVLLSDSVKLPKYTMKDGYDMYYEVTVKWSATDISGNPSGDQFDVIKVANGNSFDLSKYAQYFNDKAYSEPKVEIIEIEAKLVKPQAISVKVVDNKAYYIDENGKTQAFANEVANKVVNVNTSDVFEWNTLTNAGLQVNYGKTYTMPAVKAMKDDKDVETLVFDHWEVAANEDDLLADGKSAKGFVIENGIVVPEKFLASTDPDASEITLIAVFKNTAPNPEDSYTYETTTPNDGVKVFDEKGKYKKTIPYDEYLQKITGDDDAKFEGGSFYNSKLGQWFYYSDEKVAKPTEAAKWVIDTTVNGIADGIYFENGVQDTKAYGLKKVSGAAEDDKFFYLVSDGLYVDDYTGIWVDEDDSIYNLINGCTSDVPFTGIVERDGWATSVKDSMVDKKANGFILYGDTQYWFIDGTCNLKETEAVRQHTNGRFYYTVGAKIDFTFNGTVNGHTFVNGEAVK